MAWGGGSSSVPRLDHYPVRDDAQKMPMALKEPIAWKGYTDYILRDPKATFNFTKALGPHYSDLCKNSFGFHDQNSKI